MTSLIVHAPRVGRWRTRGGEFIDVLRSYIEPGTLDVIVMYAFAGRLLVVWSADLDEWTAAGITWVGETPRRTLSAGVLS